MVVLRRVVGQHGLDDSARRRTPGRTRAPGRPCSASICTSTLSHGSQDADSFSPCGTRRCGSSSGAARSGSGRTAPGARVLGHVVGGVHVAAGDGQPGDLGVLVEVALVRLPHGVVGDLALQQVVLQRVERRRLSAAQLGAEVVLRVEEDLPVGLPDPVVAHPAPPALQPLPYLVRVGAGGQRDRLQVEQVAVQEQLGRGDRLTHPGGGADAAHVDVDRAGARTGPARC